MTDIYDNVLEPHVAELIHIQMEQLYWKYNYNSSKGQVNKHWHVLAGHDPEAVKRLLGRTAKLTFKLTSDLDLNLPLLDRNW